MGVRTLEIIRLVALSWGLFQVGGGTPASPGPTASAPDVFGCGAQAIFEGEEQNDHLGMTVELGGDWNADGRPDVLIGGGVNGTLPVDVWLYDRVGGASSMVAKFTGFAVDAKGERPAVLSLGDIDGGGLDDLAIGVPGWKDPQQPLAAQGGVFLFFGEDYRTAQQVAAANGEPTKVLWGPEDARVIITGLEADRLGASLALADLDGDTHPDLLVGAPADPEALREGRVYAFLNQQASSLQTAVAHAATRNAMLPDLASAGGRGRRGLGAGPEGRGAQQSQQSTSVRQSAGTAEVMYVGRESRDRFGWSIANVGDLNGMRGDEILVGAIQASSKAAFTFETYGPGYAQVFTWSPAPSALYELSSFNPEGDHDLFGYSVASLGDLNGDGRNELAVGAPYYDRSPAHEDIGGIYVYRGDVGPGVTLATRLYYGGHQPYVPQDLVRLNVGHAYVGWSLASVGMSVDAVGTPDLVVGAPGTDHDRADHEAVCGLAGEQLSLADSGRVYLLGLPPAHHAWPRVLRTFGGDGGRDRLGWSVAVGSISDPDRLDILAGANGHSIATDAAQVDAEKTEAGRAYLFQTATHIP